MHTALFTALVSSLLSYLEKLQNFKVTLIEGPVILISKQSSRGDLLPFNDVVAKIYWIGDEPFREFSPLTSVDDKAYIVTYMSKFDPDKIY